MRPFHLAIPVHDLAAARGFYGDLLGCAEGRSAARWVDFDFFGHQLSVHLAACTESSPTNPVDGDAVPARHFGVVLAWPEWEALGERLGASGMSFRIPRRVRFAGLPGEQGTFFFDDPSGNVLEMKSFRRADDLFSRG